jgi:thiol-disulfide isomerase/thioredoxin
MKRHLILKLLLSLLILLVSYAAIDGRLISKLNSALRIGTSKEKLPSFTISMLEGSKKVNTDDIKSSGSFVILYFSPECPFCKEQLHEIVKNYTQLSNIPFYFLSPYPTAEIKNYFNGYDLKAYKNIIVGSDNSSQFARYYNILSVPCLAFYDKGRNLKNIRIGVTESNKIKAICDSIDRKKN